MKKRSAVLHFIEKEREKGATDKEIRHKLLDAGWSMDIIHHAMHKREDNSAHKTQQTKTVGLKINPVTLVIFGLLAIMLLALFA